jgi:hypothetical protein
MDLTIQIPDELAGRLSSEGSDLSRRALEAFAADEYKHGHLTKQDLAQLLGLETCYQLDGLLKEHAIWIEYTMEDLERERETFRRLGF